MAWLYGDDCSVEVVRYDTALLLHSREGEGEECGRGVCRRGNAALPDYFEAVSDENGVGMEVEAAKVSSADRSMTAAEGLNSDRSVKDRDEGAEELGNPVESLPCC